MFRYAFLLFWCAAVSAGESSVLQAFDGRTGERLTIDRLLSRVAEADIVLFAEKHSDAAGHALQNELLLEIFKNNDSVVLSLEEFDRSQQAVLDAWVAHELSDAGLEAERDFLNLTVKKNWPEWYLPKLQSARDNNAALVASNAPLKYSRMVRNYGCDDLPELSDAERALFDCPAVVFDPVYFGRFKQTMSRVAGKDKSIKSLDDDRLKQLFRAHRVWDATMAQSVADALSRARSGKPKVVHIVGDFHVDFDGGLLQELRHRAPDKQVLSISFYPRRSPALVKPDIGRADVVVYTR